MPQAHLDTHARYIERDTDRKIRHRNKLYYRFNHWPIWILVFFIAPGPLTFDLFERGEVLFVAAGVEHRFENFSDDFSTWVLFHGPEGGEEQHGHRDD